MLRATAVVVSVVTALSFPVVAGADPVAPRLDSPCAPNLTGAMTWLPDAETPLVCTGQWDEVDEPYPVSDRWLSSGPAVELHGQGRRNPSMLSGDWIATPSTPESRCHAEQVAVIPGSPTIGPPQVDDGQPGQPLKLEISPTMASIEISGDCLWQKAVPSGR